METLELEIPINKIKKYKTIQELKENKKIPTWTGPDINEIISDMENDNVKGNPKYGNMDDFLDELRELV